MTIFSSALLLRRSYFSMSNGLAFTPAKNRYIPVVTTLRRIIDQSMAILMGKNSYANSSYQVKAYRSRYKKLQKMLTNIEMKTFFPCRSLKKSIFSPNPGTVV
jgi:hypothetical protein